MQKLKIIKAKKLDVDLIYNLIGEMASFEKRPEDFLCSKNELEYWLFDKKIAKVMLAKLADEVIGYALYYPTFGSFSSKGKIYLEDIFIKEKYRGKGYGKALFDAVKKDALKNGYSEIEWSCLDWNKSAIEFYNHIGAKKETGRVHFGLDLKK